MRFEGLFLACKFVGIFDVWIGKRWRIAYTYLEVFYGFWDASDVQSGQIHDLRTDLMEDCEGTIRSEDNEVVMGWVHNAIGGSGEGGGFYAIGKELTSFPPWLIAKHEISHCYGGGPTHHGWFFWPPCVMSYFWLALVYGGWCGECRTAIDNHIWQYILKLSQSLHQHDYISH